MSVRRVLSLSRLHVLTTDYQLYFFLCLRNRLSYDDAADDDEEEHDANDSIQAVSARQTPSVLSLNTNLFL